MSTFLEACYKMKRERTALLDACYLMLNVEGAALEGACKGLDVPYHFAQLRAAIKLADPRGEEFN